MHSSIPFGHEGGMWDLIVLIPDHCHSKEGPLSFFTPGIRSMERRRGRVVRAAQL